MPNHPIFAPVFRGDITTVKRLLDEDAQRVDVRDAKNLAPIHVAASRGHRDVIQLLVDYGADVEGPTDPGDWTPIVFAAYRGHVEAVKALIENGAGVTAESGNPIHFAGQRRHKEICRILVDHGTIDSQVDSSDPDVLPLFRAASCYDTKSVKEILDRRPELVHSQDVDGRTPFHEACTNGDTKTVRALLKFGADVTVRDNNGQTGADRAAAHGQHAVSKLLAKHDPQA